ncbi:zinc-binding dehydrogenase [Streptomyces sp. NPDC056983]|uniref:zinc-binding dehydrogenase n=1 Tax=Streptomyces sp. NPDC056983 TaxID=3345987 RepID=UPI003629D50B
MTAAVMHEQGLPTPYAESRPFQIEEVELEGPGPGEVLVEVRGAGLCHSDLTVVAGHRKRTVPVIGGHEGAGIVREVGAGVTALQSGDHVVMTLVAGCGQCRPCMKARPALCDGVSASRSQGLLSNGARRISGADGPIFHYSGISSFAQYAVTAPNSLIRIDPSVPLDVAAMFGCAVTTGAGSVFNSARVRPGDAVAVVGLGGVGLNSVMAAKIAGAATIIGIDLNESKLPLARDLGCTHTFAARDPELASKVQDLTHGGVDFAFDVTGAQSALTLATEISCKGGEVICVGLGPKDAKNTYAHAPLVTQEKAFRGAAMGTCVPQRDIPKFVQMHLDGKLPVDRLMSMSMTFDELNGSLDRLSQGDVVRQVLLPHG